MLQGRGAGKRGFRTCGPPPVEVSDPPTRVVLYSDPGKTSGQEVPTALYFRYMIVAWIASLIGSLNANRKPFEVAGGMAFALILAMLPAGNLLWIVLFVVSLFLKINLAVMLLFLAVFSLVVPLADPLFHRLGELILIQPALYDGFTRLYNVPLLPFARFNDTVVMGSFAAGVVLFLPAVVLFRFLVVKYRTSWQPKLAESKIVKGIARIPIVSKLSSAIRHFTRLYGAVQGG